MAIDATLDSALAPKTTCAPSLSSRSHRLSSPTSLNLVRGVQLQRSRVCQVLQRGRLSKDGFRVGRRTVRFAMVEYIPRQAIARQQEGSRSCLGDTKHLEHEDSTAASCCTALQVQQQRPESFTPSTSSIASNDAGDHTSFAWLGATPGGYIIKKLHRVIAAGALATNACSRYRQQVSPLACCTSYAEVFGSAVYVFSSVASPSCISVRASGNGMPRHLTQIAFLVWSALS